jgi:hypothetical protein
MSEGITQRQRILKPGKVKEETELLRRKNKQVKTESVQNDKALLSLSQRLVASHNRWVIGISLEVVKGYIDVGISKVSIIKSHKDSNISERKATTSSYLA